MSKTAPITSKDRCFSIAAGRCFSIRVSTASTKPFGCNASGIAIGGVPEGCLGAIVFGKTKETFPTIRETGKRKKTIAIFPIPYCHLAGKIFAVTGRNSSINPTTTLPAMDMARKFENRLLILHTCLFREPVPQFSYFILCQFFAVIKCYQEVFD